MLKKIAVLCDKDQDGFLNDFEIQEFQVQGVNNHQP